MGTFRTFGKEASKNPSNKGVHQRRKSTKKRDREKPGTRRHNRLVDLGLGLDLEIKSQKKLSGKQNEKAGTKRGDEVLRSGRGKESWGGGEIFRDLGED